MMEANRIGGFWESRVYMEKKILVLDADVTSCQELVKLLVGRQYSTTSIQILSDLEGHLEKGSYLAVILDIDSVSVDNRCIRELTIKYPEAHFLCTSKDRFHPDLKDAICYHIYACLTKPVDPDEIFFLLRSIYEDDTDPKK
jgi:DNA-binding NtrC family response regulator